MLSADCEASNGCCCPTWGCRTVGLRGQATGKSLVVCVYTLVAERRLWAIDRALWYGVYAHDVCMSYGVYVELDSAETPVLIENRAATRMNPRFRQSI